MVPVFVAQCVFSVCGREKYDFASVYMQDALLCKSNQKGENYREWDKNQKNKKFIQEMQAKFKQEAIK